MVGAVIWVSSELLYRNPCFLWFQCWLETRNSVWICLNLVPWTRNFPKKDSKRENGLFLFPILLVCILNPNLKFWSQFCLASKCIVSGAFLHVWETILVSKHLAGIQFRPNKNLPKMRSLKMSWERFQGLLLDFWNCIFKTFHRFCIAQRTCWSACRAVLDLLIQVTSLLGWCSLKRFKSARTRETQPGCLKESFSQIIW